MIHALLLILVLGVVFYLVQTYIPMAPPFKLIFQIVCVVIAIVLLLQALGFGNFLGFRL